MCFAPAGLAPLQSMTRGAVAPSCTALTRFFAPSAQPSHRDPPLPDVCLPGSRCTLALTMRLGAFLPRWPPWYRFNQARSRGSYPSELDLTAVAIASRLSLPLSCWPCRTVAMWSCAVAGAPKVPNWGSRERSARPVFRVCPAVGWGLSRWILSAPRRPWLSWVGLPGALPFRAPTSTVGR